MGIRNKLGLTIIIILSVPLSIAVAEICWNYVDWVMPLFLDPDTDWECDDTSRPENSRFDPPTAGYPDSTTTADDATTWHLLDFHVNWHCVNTDFEQDFAGNINPTGSGPGISNPTYGTMFLAFHKQIIYDFDVYRERNFDDLPRIEIWENNNYPPGPDFEPLTYGIPGVAQTGWPGSGVNWDQTGAEESGGICTLGTGRASGAYCFDCVELPLEFIKPVNYEDGEPGGTLHTKLSADELGNDLDAGGWHGSFHNGVAKAMVVDNNGKTLQEIGDEMRPAFGNEVVDNTLRFTSRGDPVLDAIKFDSNFCFDISPVATSPRDSMFWRAHKQLDEVHSDWQELQPTDIMVVLDRSGSMSSDASSASAGKSKLDAAKEAIEMFAGVIENGRGFNIGIQTFATSASSSPELPLTTVDGVVPTVHSVLSSVTAGGWTSIGDGLLKAQQELNNGPNERKAILLLTDGKENRPDCLDGSGIGCTGSTDDIALNQFDGIQICAVGYGERSNLDGIVLRELTERQGGIFTAFTELDVAAFDTSNVMLQKFFLQCFANISNVEMASDPIGILPSNQDLSEPTIMNVAFDNKVIFVLSWQNEKDPLELLITTPSGNEVTLNDPNIETERGNTWQFVRIPLPYQGEQSGEWQAQAKRIGDEFSVQSSSSVLPTKIQFLAPPPMMELRTPFNVYLINAMASGPANITPFNSNFHFYTSDPVNPVLRITQSSRPIGDFDKVDVEVTITSPLYGEGNLLVEHGVDKTSVISSDTIDVVSSKLMELKKENKGNILKVTTLSVYADQRPPQNVVQYFKRDGTGSGIQDTWFNLDKDTLINTKLEISDVEGNIKVHAWGKCSPTDCDWGSENASNISEGKYNVIWNPGFAQRSMLLELHNESIIPTITKTYKLYDDGTHGDRFANNNYWSNKIPELGQVEGYHHLHYVVTIVHNGKTFNREADQTIYVEVKIDPKKTDTKLEDLDPLNGRERTMYTIIPTDSLGNFVGPGKQDLFEIITTGDAKIEDGITDDGKGGYQVIVSWTKDEGEPTLILSQNDKIRQTVNLPNGDIAFGLAPIPDHVDQSGGICGFNELTVLTDDLKSISCLNYSIDGGSAEFGFLDSKSKSLSISTNTLEDGTFTIEIPRSMLDSKLGQEDSDFVVFAGSTETKYSELKTDEVRELTVEFPEGTKRIYIQGTFTIPEFGSVAILILVITFISLIAVTRKSILNSCQL